MNSPTRGESSHTPTTSATPAHTLAEWTAARPIDDRITNILNGGGATGGTKLVDIDDSDPDTLTGGDDEDWFRSFVPDIETDKTAADRP